MRVYTLRVAVVRGGGEEEEEEVMAEDRDSKLFDSVARIIIHKSYYV